MNLSRGRNVLEVQQLFWSYMDFLKKVQGHSLF